MHVAWVAIWKIMPDTVIMEPFPAHQVELYNITHLVFLTLVPCTCLDILFSLSQLLNPSVIISIGPVVIAHNGFFT